MTRAARNALLALLVLLLLVYGGAVGFLALNETRMVFASAGMPRLGRALPASDAGLSWDTLRTRASDGVPVALLVSRANAARARPWALYLHGNAGLLGSRGNVARYRLLRDAGFDVLAVEYRGYGISSGAGTPSEAGVLADARAGWDHLVSTLGADPARVVIYGWSLGSGPAVQLASAVRPAALVTEGAFTSLPDIGAALYPWMPVRLIMRNQFDNLARAQQLGIPWILFHGRQDVEVPFTHSERLAANAPHARLVALDAGHDDGVIADRTVTLSVLRALADSLSAVAPATSAVTDRTRAASPARLAP